MAEWDDVLNEATQRNLGNGKTGSQMKEVSPAKQALMGAMQRQQEVAQPQPQAQEQEQNFIGRLAEVLTGSKRETEYTKSLPEFRKTEAARTDVPLTEIKAKDLRFVAAMMATIDDDSKIGIIKENIPEAKFFRDKKGNIIVDVGGKLSVLNKPGFSGTDAVNAITQVLLFAPATKLVGLGKSVLAKIGLGAAGSALTESVIQRAEQAAGSGKEYEYGRTLAAGGGGVLGELVAPLAKGVKTLRAAKKLGKVTEPIKEAAEITERTGVGFFPGQQALDPDVLRRQAAAAKLPAGVQVSIDALKKQNKQIGDALDKTLKSVAPSEALVTGPERFREAARGAIEAEKAIRRDLTKPIYEQAWKEAKNIDVGPIIKDVNERTKDLVEGEVLTELNTVLKNLRSARSLKQLNSAKRELDRKIYKFGEKALGNDTKRELVQIQEQITNYMKDVSPSFKKAQEEFAKASPAVDQVKALFGKTAKIPDDQLKNLGRRVFDAQNVNPKVIADTKKIIQKQDPEAWNFLLRSELERRIGAAAVDVGEESVENVPKQLLKSMFGNTNQRRNLYASLDGEIKKNVRYFEEALKRAREGRPYGTVGISQKEAERSLKGGFVSAIRDLFKSPVRAVAGVGERKATDTRVARLAKVLYDPTPKEKQIFTQLRKTNPGRENAARLLIKLIGREYFRPQKEK